jgi:hypothetical protein
MKAQRRHELKTNTLAEAMAQLPNTGLRNAATSLAIVLGGVLIGLLIRFRISSGAERTARAADNLAQVREEISDIKQSAAMSIDPGIPAETYRDVNSRLESILADAGSGNPQLAAEALIARGDANWYMAAVASSTTQPSAMPQSQSELLGAAQAAYEQVVSTYPQENFSVNTARFSLAAIAENRSDWDAARKQYQSIVDDPQAGDLLHIRAHALLAGVDQLQHPPLLAAATQPTTAPSAP